MAGDGCFARLLQRLAETALRVSGPATRLAGSVPAAAVITAVLVGVYEVVIGSVYLRENWRFYYVIREVVEAAGCLAYLTAFANAALIFGVVRRKNEYLQNILSAVLTGYFLISPITLIIIIGGFFNPRWIFLLWEVPRILAYPLHMSLVYCLLVEVRGETAPAPAAAPADGWLQNNLALGADAVQLKVHGGSDLPAAFKPPVQLDPPARTHTHGAPSGPLSSSDA